MAIEKGADGFIDSTCQTSMNANKMKLDLILNTLPINHQCADFMELLNYKGVNVQLGLVTGPHVISQLPLVRKRMTLAGSHLGGLAATQEVINLCAKHNLFPDI
jgi:alcohol dehydrogenase (NADP+)